MHLFPIDPHQLTNPIRPYSYLPGWFSFHELYTRAVREAEDGDTLVEVGVYMGRSACYLLEEIEISGKRLQVDLVDQWDLSILAAENLSMAWGEPVEAFKKRVMGGADRFCDLVRALLSAHPNVRHLGRMIQGDSTATASVYGDNSLRFVFIDADHRYAPFKADIRAWWPKVKSTGTLAGHDWLCLDVQRALKEFVTETGVNLEADDKQNVWWIKRDSVSAQPTLRGAEWRV